MEMALSRIVNGLSAEGFVHTIVVLKGEAIIRAQFDPSVAIHCLHATARDVSLPFRLRRLIRSARPSAIHVRNLPAWPEIALARWTVLPLVPLIFSFHGLAEARPLPGRWRLMARALARASSFVFTVSEGSKRFLVDQVGLRAGHVAVIANGVDTTRFHAASVPATGPGLRIGTLGSLSAVKNQALLIRACKRLVDDGVDLSLDIAGEGPLRADLERLIASLGLGQRVRLPGHLADTPAFLRALDVFVLPSDSEAHPNALSEAMACGVPCIASRVGGVPEIVDQGRAGLIFEPGDEDGLVERLKTLAASAERRRTFGAAALQRTRDCYSMDVMMRNYRALYLRLSGDPRNVETRS